MRSKKRVFRLISGSICAPQGFLASGVSAGIKKNGKKDIALIFSKELCHAAGTFTTNAVKAAPVLFDLQKIHRRRIRGIIVNSGNANACTGRLGLQNTKKMSEMASKAIAAHGFAHKHLDFLVCSTGRIGVQLPMKKIQMGIQKATASSSKKDREAAQAIMTTDTFPKKIAVELQIGGKTVRIGGIAKGAGMIQPGMSASGKRPALHATMLSFITTDAAIEPKTLQHCLDRAIAQSFNRISVDGDMSTNDTVLLLANGLSSNRILKSNSPDLHLFQNALNHVTLSLALMIVRDGEGISKVVTLKITGAASAKDAELAARAVGNSTLVKCSWFGEDPNWGRVCDAIGYSGAHIDFSKFSIKYNDKLLVKNGLQINKNLKKASHILKEPSYSIECSLGLGKYKAVLYTTDLTKRYVELNKGE